MIIRKAESKDKNLFITLANEFYHLPAVLHTIDISNFEKTFDAVMQPSPFTSLFFAEENGTTAGYVLLSFTWSNEAGGLTVWIEEIYICPEFQGNGLGSELLTFVKNSFPDAKRFRLEVSPENEKVKKLYRKYGFEFLSYQQMVCEV